MQSCPRILISLLLAALAVPAPVNGQSPTGPSQWLADYGFARKEADRLGLPLLIHFSATWCGPCQQMEQETLNSQALRSMLGTHLIALKVDSDENPGLIEAFRVDSLPTDVIIAPGGQGRIVSRTSGYQSRNRYMANATRWGQQFPEERAAAIARLNPPTRPGPSVVGPGVMLPDQQAPVIKRPHQTAATSPVVPPQNLQSPGGGDPQAQLIGLSGYSPVAIKTRRVWVKGREELFVAWQGVVYYLANDREYMAFKMAPHRYAPRMLGCDPVLLWESDRAIQGMVDFGAFYDGELYLFKTSENRDTFKVNPDQFVRIRHVLNPEEILGTRIR